ncbi:hypothetical protein CPB83DRAFT_584564 [Crepidotus variabilis]|uniref:Uncharacterized protein n=1 Tax=Crepidotus variabilis TaxID=179855 RepID=A0A9P6EPD5_9AGAR|nr:hypothetical protein CPB83DRAFT_584564 [Crepidotus variabilis]
MQSWELFQQAKLFLILRSCWFHTTTFFVVYQDRGQVQFLPDQINKKSVSITVLIRVFLLVRPAPMLRSGVKPLSTNMARGFTFRLVPIMFQFSVFYHISVVQFWTFEILLPLSKTTVNRSLTKHVWRSRML